MKQKLLLLLLTAAMLLMLTACGEVKNVEMLIDQIGTVSLESGDAISAAQGAFDTLKDDQKEKVANIAALENAKTQYAQLLNERDYADAAAAFEAKDFALAKKLYSSLGSFEDAAERYTETLHAEAYYEAVDLFDAGKYKEAARKFEETDGYLDSQDKLFDTGVALLDASAYSDAISVFSVCNNSSKEAYIAYANGAINMASGNYEKAQQFFEAAKDIPNGEEMLRGSIYMQAEENLEKGYLNTAKGLYEQLPEEFSYQNGKTVSERLAALKKFDSFVVLCGIWKSNDMNASVRETHTSTGLWDQWDGNGWNYQLEITCKINDDDTATMRAKANFWHYTNYSSLSRNLKYSDDSCLFTYTGTRAPYKMDYSMNFTYEYSGTLRINGKKFRLDYQILDRNSSMYFDYTYKSFGTYDTLVKAL